MKHKKFFNPSIIALFLFVCSLSFANAFQNDSFGEGQFKKDSLYTLTSSIYSTTTLTNPSGNFIVGDFDNDGTVTVLLIDDGYLKLYNVTPSKSLRLVNELDVDAIIPYAPLITHNIVAGDEVEIIGVMSYGSNNQSIFIVNQTGTSLKMLSNFSLSTSAIASAYRPNYVTGLSCSESYCIAVGTRPDENRMTVNMFNIDGIKDSDICNEGGALEDMVLPRVSYIPTIDYDYDGKIEYILNTHLVAGSEGNIFTLEYDTNNITCSHFAEYSMVTALGENAKYSEYVSNPIIFDIDEISSNGQEIIVGYMNSATGFRMKVYRADGTLIKTYPNTFGIVGEVYAGFVGNTFVGNMFSNAEQFEACTSGFANSSLRYLCISGTSGLDDNNEYNVYNIPYNITQANDVFNFVTWSIQENTEIDGEINKNEYISPFGVMNYFDVDISVYTQNIYYTDEVIKYFNFQNAYVYPYDIDNNKKQDILAMSNTNLYLLSDGFVNTGCSSENCITAHSINPCSPMKNGTNLEITIQVSDVDLNDVSAQACIYYGSDNEQCSGWTQNLTTGTTFTFSDLILNKTVSNARLLIQGRETGVYSEIETYEYPMTVTTTGYEFGQIICSYTSDLTDTTYENETSTVYNNQTTALNVSNNPIKSAIDALGIKGLGYGIIWLIIMVIVSIFILIDGLQHGYNINMLGAIIGVIDFMILLIGVYLQFISVAILIIISILGILIVAIIIKQSLTGGNSGGGA